jgi:hypothetical protein
MRIKHLLLAITLVFACSVLFADKVELNDAHQVATKFYNQKYKVNFPQTTGDFYITETFINRENDEPLIYIFNFNNDGYAVVPADDAIYPVVGFSFEGAYDQATFPENAHYVINEFGKQVIYVRENSVRATAEVSMAWENLRSDDIEKLKFVRNNRDIDPMVFAMWNQDSPYNAMCPADPSGPGGHVYAGCVATAMSMIMYHWRYPEQGTGSHSYYAPGYGTQTANFGQTTYDYNGMVNSSDNTYNEMIALLQYHCGVAVDMNYSPNGSGAYNPSVTPAIKNYFGYASNAQIIYRGSLITWKAYLDQQMEWSQPVYYAGCDNSGCHAFVVDGTQEQSDDTYYHFNFGWSGSGNGWYLVTNAGGYNQDNAMVRNFIPDPANYPYAPPEEEVIITSLNGTLEDCSGPKDDYQDNISSSWLIDPQTETDSVSYIKIDFSRFATEADGDFVRIYDGPDTDSPMIGEFSGNDLPSAVVSENNQVLITFTTNASVTANGWLLTYKAYQPAWCSGMQTFTEPTGTFNDGSNNFYYNNNTACMFRITPEYTNETTLYFNYLDTEEDFDVVKVFDYDTQALLAEVSGNVIPDPIVSPSGQFFLTFNSNSSIRGIGWEVYYEVGNVGIEENSAFQNVKLYPNPAQNLVNISFRAPQANMLKVSIVTISGMLVYSNNIDNFSGTYSEAINVSGMARGVYFLNLLSDQGNLVKKLVIE